jgi:ribonuclease HII
MWVTGVDENGMGPLLGPLVATAVTVELRRYDRARLRRRGLELGIGDSKQTSAFGKMAHAESLALALAERFLGRPATDADALLEAFSLEGLLTLRGRCPDASSRAQCWSEALALPAFGGELAEGRALLKRLEGRTLKVRRVRSGLLCAGALNEAVADGSTKVREDLTLFERLILDARAAAPDDLEAICGQVSGIRRYPSYFRHFEEAAELRESGGYAVPGVGTVRFEVKADDKHLPVGLASMVGKLVRELAMRRMSAFYRRHDPELERVSGYHDPRTKRFVDDSRSLRRHLRVATECFERRC